LNKKGERDTVIREDVAKRLKELLNVEDIPLNVPPDRKLGDFSSAICLSLAKQRRRPPMEIARETADQLKSKLPPFILDVAVTPPGYLNFSVHWPAVTRSLIPLIFAQKGPFGKSASTPPDKVFVEHTSVNPNKAMHIGHLRNAVLGDTVARVFRWLGKNLTLLYRTESVFLRKTEDMKRRKRKSGGRWRRTLIVSFSK
jgi:arginyl-tRNA synthetase